jgi:hypothetical protein
VSSEQPLNAKNLCRIIGTLVEVPENLLEVAVFNRLNTSAVVDFVAGQH